MEYQDAEKHGYDVHDSPKAEGDREAVDMRNVSRKESIVYHEAADLYGDIQTAESEHCATIPRF